MLRARRHNVVRIRSAKNVVLADRPVDRTVIAKQKHCTSSNRKPLIRKCITVREVTCVSILCRTVRPISLQLASTRCKDWKRYIQTTGVRAPYTMPQEMWTVSRARARAQAARTTGAMNSNGSLKCQ
jgi:hypothetical protein